MVVLQSCFVLEKQSKKTNTRNQAEVVTVSVFDVEEIRLFVKMAKTNVSDPSQCDDIFLWTDETVTARITGLRTVFLTEFLTCLMGVF